MSLIAQANNVPAPRPNSPSPRVLVVDDDPTVLSYLASVLTMGGFDCVPAPDAAAALDAIDSSDDIGIVVSDLKMPGKSGLDLVTEIKQRGGDLFEFVLMTGYGDVVSTISALRLGVSDYLLKPFEKDAFLDVVRRADERYMLRRSRREFRFGLVDAVKRRSEEVQFLKGEIDGVSEDSMRRLAAAAEYRDCETGAHNWRLGAYAKFVASRLGWSTEECRQIGLAAPLHDVGKIGIPDGILMKPGPLTAEEFDQLKRHCMIGWHILSGSSQAMLKEAANIARYHHERWNGGGYPEGIAGDEIPIKARIVALCDVYDALRSTRPYKPALAHDEAVRVILDGDDRTTPEQFDPSLLEIFKDNNQRFDEIFGQSREPSAGQTPPTESEK